MELDEDVEFFMAVVDDEIDLLRKKIVDEGYQNRCNADDDDIIARDRLDPNDVINRYIYI